MFHYFKTSYIICIFFAKFIYNEYIRPYFFIAYCLHNFASDLPENLATRKVDRALSTLDDGDRLVAEGLNSTGYKGTVNCDVASNLQISFKLEIP